MAKKNMTRKIFFLHAVSLFFLPSFCMAAVHQMTDNSAADQHPSLYNGTIAWDSDVDWSTDIFYWDGTTTHQITNDTTGDKRPSLYNGTIAWESGADREDTEIFYWDGSTIHQITDNSVSDRSPSLYNGTIVWHGWDGTHSHIYYWDGDSIYSIASNPGSGSLWYSLLHNGEVAWQGIDGNVGEGGWDWEIYLWGNQTLPPPPPNANSNFTPAILLLLQ